MRLSSLSFLVDEAFKSIRRNGLMSLAALTTVTIAMAVLGGALFTLHRLDQLIESQPRQFEVVAFLNTDVEREDSEDLKTRVGRIPGVAHVRLFTKEEAWAEMQDSDRKRGENITAALEGANPLPDALHIRLSDPKQTAAFRALLCDRAQYPEIDKVADALDTLEKLFAMHRVVRNVGGAAAALLFLATAFVIQNTIRLTVLARRREIRIMQLVGATPGFIRFPMVLEGIFYGAAGAGIASVAVLFVVSQVSAYAATLHSPLVQDMAAPVASAAFVSLLIGLGAVIGMAGSMLSLRRFLKRI